MGTFVNIDRNYICSCAAIALYQISCWLLNAWIFPFFVTDVPAAPVALVLTSAGCCLAALVFLWVFRWVPRRIPILMFSLAPLAISVTTLSLGMQEQSGILIMCGCICYGTMGFWTFILPALTLVDRSEGEIVVCILVAILVCSIAEFAGSLVLPSVTLAFTLFFVTAAGAIALSLRIALNGPLSSPVYAVTSFDAIKPQTFFSATHPALLAFLVSGVAFGCGATTLGASGIPVENIASIIPLALAALFVIPTSHRSRVDTLYLTSALFVLAGFIFFFPSSIAADMSFVANISNIFFNAGYGLFVLTAFMFIAAVGAKSPLDALSMSFMYYLLVDSGTTLGALLRESFITPAQSGPNNLAAYLTIAIISSLFASYIIAVANSSELSRSILRLPGLSSSIEREQSLDLAQRCRRCAERYALTPREQEILSYLALGYTAVAIKGKLTISQNTAKSHIKNIYRKMGIHSQQQLIDEVFG